MARKSGATCCGLVIEAKCPPLTAVNAPFNDWLMSRSTRPLASAYLKTCPLVCKALCAVSMAFLLSMRCNTSSNSGACVPQ